MRINNLNVDQLIELRSSIEIELRNRTQTMQRQLAALGGRRARGGRRGKVPPKYRGPNGETWSGRGQHPRWMRPFLRKGRDPESFRI